MFMHFTGVYAHILNPLFYCSYETLCEAVDLVYDVSASLCLVMGLPLREFSQKEESASGNKQGDIDGGTSSQPASPGSRYFI